ncbi:SOS response-associated peptidase [Vibrio sp. DW001]|uniref:SOS response-associated peptidase n=1 Tax=Vibrio sp. DW001 TaxID=2912315 RepID=UPI0023B0C448|nr:SOS response-associated peptidase family protein [Vibrio sp. DW001]WED27262.1 SOS response-associated peptidase [Vibrio sp. DW001]
MNIIDDPLAEAVSAALGISFFAKTNSDLCPSQQVSVVGKADCSLHQFELLWGVKPSWANRAIINAQAESVASKATFSASYISHRVVVPCSGWYEWKEEEGSKQKYLFSDIEDRPLYMAGIALANIQNLVTLTTQSNSQCATIHHRMPLLLRDSDVNSWLYGSVEQANALVSLPYQRELKITTSKPLSLQGVLF